MPEKAKRIQSLADSNVNDAQTKLKLDGFLAFDKVCDVKEATKEIDLRRARAGDLNEREEKVDQAIQALRKAVDFRASTNNLLELLQRFKKPPFGTTLEKIELCSFALDKIKTKLGGRRNLHERLAVAPFPDGQDWQLLRETFWFSAIFGALSEAERIDTMFLKAVKGVPDIPDTDKMVDFYNATILSVLKPKRMDKECFELRKSVCRLLWETRNTMTDGVEPIYSEEMKFKAKLGVLHTEEVEIKARPRRGIRTESTRDAQRLLEIAQLKASIPDSVFELIQKLFSVVDESTEKAKKEIKNMVENFEQKKTTVHQTPATSASLRHTPISRRLLGYGPVSYVE